VSAKRWILAVAAVVAMVAGPHASASPYNERCGDGTPHGCVQHCVQYHGGWNNLDDCLYRHYLV
jgi:hypothetical protein